MTTRLPGPPRLCVRCDRVRPHYAKGMCMSCYCIARRGPYQGTGNPAGRGVLRSADAVASRMDDYQMLRRRGYGVREAARRTGVSERTARRYERRLREQASDDVQQGAA